jgi:hypothetical protein
MAYKGIIYSIDDLLMQKQKDWTSNGSYKFRARGNTKTFFSSISMTFIA